MQNRSRPNPIVPDFTPVPRKYRFDGWTPERQRAFIAALAATGSVTAAARSIGMAKEGAYQMRLHPQAASFRAAWEAALDAGLRTLADIAIDRVRDGVPVPVFYKGEQCGEKRWYNDRLLMFVLRHHDPARYGAPASLPRGTRHAETLAREAAANCPVCRERREAAEAPAPDNAAPPPENDAKGQAESERIFKMYQAKVRSERQYRLEGQVVAADYTLRQLTHLELMLVSAGMKNALLDLWTTRPGPYGTQELFACEISQVLEELRREVWYELGDPIRPPLPHHELCLSTAMHGSEDQKERYRYRWDAEIKMARYQTQWEATARADTFAEWKAAHARRKDAEAAQGDEG